MPIIVLAADHPWGPQVKAMAAAGKLPADVPLDFGYVVDTAQKKAQERLAKLVPNEKYITNTNSGDDIHKEQPQLVITAIRDVVEAVRSGGRQLTQSVNPRPDFVLLQWMALIGPARARAEVVSQFWWRAACHGYRE